MILDSTDTPEFHALRVEEIQRLTGITGLKGHLQINALRMLHAANAEPGPYKNPDLFHAMGYLNNLLIEMESIMASRKEGASVEELRIMTDEMDGTLGAMIKHFSLATHQYAEGTTC